MNAEERARAVLSRTSAVGRAGFDGLVSLIAAAIRDAEREAAERMRERAAMAAMQTQEDALFGPRGAIVNAIRALPLEVTP